MIKRCGEEELYAGKNCLILTKNFGDKILLRYLHFFSWTIEIIVVPLCDKKKAISNGFSDCRKKFAVIDGEIFSGDDVEELLKLF